MNIYYRRLNREIDWRWFNLHLPIIECQDSQGIVAIDADTELPVAAVIVDNVTETSVQAHFMVTTPMVMRHGFLEEGCAYVFEGLKKQTMFAYVLENNEASLSITEKIGFEVVCHLENSFSEGVGYIVKRLEKEQCNFLPEVRNG